MTYESIDRNQITSAFQSSLDQALSSISDVTSVEKRQFIYMREPDTAADGFDGYPFAYLEDYSINMEAATMNGQVFRAPAVAEIVIDAEDEDADSKMKHDELSDKIITAFMIDERYDIEQAGWAGVTMENNTRSTTVEQTGKPIIRRTVEFSFDLLVSFE